MTDKTNKKQDLVAASRLVDETGLKNRLIEFFTKWEVLLAIIFVLMFIVFGSITPKFLRLKNLLNQSGTFMEKSIMALPMIFIIMCGDIDISVASIVALSGFGIGMAAEAGAPTPVIVLVGLAIGLVCGLVNGLLVTGLNMPAIAVTLATQSIYRGISKGVLGEHACTTFPESFQFFGQGTLGGSHIPFSLLLYAVLAVIMYFVLQRTVYGRRLYAIGSCAEAARFSGIKVKKARVINFALMGLFAGIAAVILASRICSVRSNIAENYDMETITLVVLGGVAITGGKGTVYGVVISSFLVGFLKFGLTLMKVNGTYQTIAVGALLIIAVLLPRLLDMFKANRKLAKQQAQARLEEAGAVSK
ncbi:MAG: ABC transporter permease [Sphaerochaetaceae bacterium]|jgi:rhamnose transport system permease protein|nr:ABC transporter permease [Sphaerochaetaceae bacterium]MDD3163255.1 ABC transporter permease [Sphaerochaetaceae bacterium]MDD4007394.1 ABC transporter permease [Sphaerochaetaceae bacterium]MDD4396173.1 ABC transporter permease [Sphaerochaetaceae bacterium]